MQAGRTAGRSVAVLPLVAAQQTYHEHPPTKCNDQEHETEELQLGRTRSSPAPAITALDSTPHLKDKTAQCGPSESQGPQCFEYSS